MKEGVFMKDVPATVQHIQVLPDDPVYKPLNELTETGFVMVPAMELKKLLKDSSYLDLILDVYRQRGETYDLKELLKAITKFYGQQTVKDLQDERIKLEVARQELEKAKAAKKEEIMELLKKFTDGDDDE